jgi:SulP family sulfate permease
MPVSTSLSASSLNDRSGARTGLASLTSGAIVLLTLLVLAPLFSDLPKAVLAALIIEAVVMGMMDVPEMRRLARVQRFDFWIAIAAIVGTLVFGVLAGVMIGIGLSLLWLISVATRPPMPLLAREPGTEVYRELDEHPSDEQSPGVVVLRLDGGLFFATSDALEDRVREVALSTPDITGIVLDCAGIDFIDSQGSAKLCEILELTEQAEVTLRLARVKPAVRELLSRDGFLDRLGDARTHGNVHRAVEAQIGQDERSSPEDQSELRAPKKDIPPPAWNSSPGT